jgi:hypothetical protein
LAFVALAFGVIAAPAAVAVTPEASNLSVTAPLDVGGTVLQPGDYVIHVLPGPSNRNLLRVTNKDGSEVFATVLAIPHALGAAQNPGDTSFVYYPAVAEGPRALRTWFAPDATSGGGHDIVYPRARAMELAAASSEPVVAYAGETAPSELQTAELIVVTPDQEVDEYVAPAPALEPEPEPVAVASMPEMPQTAGRVPLAGMIGLLLLGTAFAIRGFRLA